MRTKLSFEYHSEPMWMLRKFDNFDLLVIDDLGHLPQGAEESEV